MKLTIRVMTYQGLPDTTGISAYFDASGGSIGRSPENRLILPDPDKFVSRQHARILFENNQFILQDCSTEGTYLPLKDMLLQQDKIPLADGERLQVGEYELQVSLSATELFTPFPEPVRQLDLVAGSFDGFDGQKLQSEHNPAAFASFIDQPDASAIHESFIPPKVADAPLSLQQDEWGLDDWLKGSPPLPLSASQGQQQEDLGWLPKDLIEGGFSSPEPEHIGPIPVQHNHPVQHDENGNWWEPPVAPPIGQPPVFPEPLPLPLSPPDLPSPVPPEHALTLVIKLISYKGRQDNANISATFDVLGGSIGRNGNNHLVLPDPEKIVSGCHAHISFGQGQFIYEDCSTNGTRLGSKDVFLNKAQKPLTDGMRLWIGEYELQAFLQSSGFGLPPVIPASNSDSELLKAFLAGAGIDQEAFVPPQQTLQLMRTAGELLRNMVDGLMETLAVRAKLKSEFRIPVTTIQSHQNNPLKANTTVDNALALLLKPENSGFLGPQAAVQESFNDLISHQMAMMAGIQAALADSLQKFDPTIIEKAQTDAMLNKKAKCWEYYTEKYPQLAATAKEQLFGEVFAQAYEAQMQMLISRNP